MTMTTALFCAHFANGDAARCACAMPLLTLSESAVLLDIERTALLSMITDPEVDPERDWHVVRDGSDIYIPVWFVRELLAGGW